MGKEKNNQASAAEKEAAEKAAAEAAEKAAAEAAEKEAAEKAAAEAAEKAAAEAAEKEAAEKAAAEAAEKEAAENTGPSDLLIERVEAAAKAKGASIKMMREVYFAIEEDTQKRVNLIKAGDTAAARDIVKNAAEKFLKECGKK